MKNTLHHKLQNTMLWVVLMLPALVSAQTAGESNAPPPPPPPAPAPAPYAVASGMGAEGGAQQTLVRLHLSAEQQPYWQAFMGKVDAYSRLFYEQKPAAAYQADAAPRQIGRMVDSLQNRLAALDDIEAAAKALYATLDGEQQKVANESLARAIPVFASGAQAECEPRGMDRPNRGGRHEGGQRPPPGGGGTGGGMGGMGGGM